MEEMMREMKMEMEEMKRRMAALMTQRDGEKMEEDEDENENDEAADADAAAGNLLWCDVLYNNVVIPSVPVAVELTQLLGNPSLLASVRTVIKNTPQYHGVPVTPVARRHALDQKLTITQKKQESIMNLLVHSLETGDPAHVKEAAAVASS